jgi:biotin carboxylase
MNKRRYILFIGGLSKKTREKILPSISARGYEILVLKQKSTGYTGEIKNSVVRLNYNNKHEIQKFMDNFGSKIVSITARSDLHIPKLQKIIPFAPKHVYLPSVKALQRSTEKVHMRRAFRRYDKNITPQFKIFKEFEKEKFEVIKKKFLFPVIIKPSGLASSMLVQSAHYPEELENILKNTISKYSKLKGRGDALILVEELIEGTVYSTDVHVDAEGTCYFNPFVKYIMSNQKGFDDFFVAEVFTPVKISPESELQAKEVSQKGINALGLRSTTAHVELIHNDFGWKIIEIGPRLGGNRSLMYKHAYNINIDLNDINIHMNKKPLIPKKIQGYCLVMRFYPNKEGFIKSIKGINTIKKMPEVLYVLQSKKKGDRSMFAKNGGEAPLKISIATTNRQTLVEIKRRIQKLVHIETVSSRKKLI